MKLLSVIIPIYNAEKYLKECLESIIHQTYSNLEIILVDDGSTDNSAEICDEYFKFDPQRVKCLHKKNEGVMKARNDGIRYASGEYIALVDADDCLDLEMYEILINQLEKSDSDISVCMFKNEYGKDVHVLKHQNSIPELKTYDKRGSLIALAGYRNAMKNGYSFVWNKIYTRKAIEGVWFRDDVAITDDLMFSWDVISKNVDQSCFTNLPMYHYRYVFSSITKNSNIAKQEKALRAWEIIQKDVTEYKLGRKCEVGVGCSYIVWNIKLCEKLLWNDGNDLKYYELAKKNILSNKQYIKYLGFRHRLLCGAILMSWKVYQYLGKMNYYGKKLFVSIT